MSDFEALCNSMGLGPSSTDDDDRLYGPVMLAMRNCYLGPLMRVEADSRARTAQNQFISAVDAWLEVKASSCPYA